MKFKALGGELLFVWSSAFRRSGPAKAWTPNTLALTMLAWISLAFASHAHIGSPNVFFEGNAGPYPVRVVVRPPGVIPGLAEISVRVNTNGVQRVTVLPMRWNTGRPGAPRPDDAAPVTGETNLFNGQLWFMQGGAQSVEVAVIGTGGTGTVIVPVNAVATRVLPMPSQLGKLLGALGLLLVLLAASIVGTAVRESVLAAGNTPSSKRRWLARGMTAGATVVITVLLWSGKRWWDAEANDYRNNRLYRPLEAKAAVRFDNGQTKLRIEQVFDPARRAGPLVPDHGKLMHLFLMREPQLDVFAHLHPIKIDWQTFDTVLPELPAGNYRLYADVTYETGYADTMSTSVVLPDVTNASPSRVVDPDDSWRTVASPEATGSVSKPAPLAPGLAMTWNSDGSLMENRDTRLRFTVRDESGRAVKLEPYMGMAGHLVLRHADGSVFTHLHPSGSFSMAAKQLFELRAEGKVEMKVASVTNEPMCKLPALRPDSPDTELAFPYAFPKSGQYRMWVQTKINGEVFTGVFDAAVAAAQSKR